MGETVSEEPSVNEAMAGEEYAKDIQTSKGVFKYWIEEDREPDNIKLFYYVKGPDGKVHDVDMNPYEYNPYSPENIEKVKKWIESGMPKTKIKENEEEDLEEYYESPKWDMIPEGDEHTCEGNEFYEMYGDFNADAKIEEAEYRGRKVKLGKPMRGDVKKFRVFVRNPKTGKVKKVNFGDPNMRIKKSNPKRRKSFRASINVLLQKIEHRRDIGVAGNGNIWQSYIKLQTLQIINHTSDGQKNHCLLDGMNIKSRQ